MKPLTADEIRTLFLEYFERKSHTVVPSSSLVPHNDPTLLFTNAGMNQFKDVFLGNEKRNYVRATSSQKCVRAGGKHNDLENVGFTARHHTFFEMLGNFSFGDYFKKEAIQFGWDFVTNILQLPKDRLYVTVFHDDDEAAEIWEKQEKVPKDRIYRFGEKDNFWSMGDTGPCGPCSEIFFDRGIETAGKDCVPNGKNPCGVGCECDRYMEIWNLVFMQFDRDKKGNLNPLPKPSVDTGAGLERIASVLQEVGSNYETDLFQGIIGKVANLVSKSYKDSNPETQSAFHVVADHARATTFLISDGVMPSNEGRGYVLRRIMRRAIRFGRKLGFDEPFFSKACGFVIDQMSGAYPEIKEQRSFVEKAVLAEEEQFFKTLERGLSLLDEAIAELGKSKSIPGDIAFKLYDTYGFPLDLTRVIAEEHGLSVDEKGFESCMEVQRSESRKNWKGSGDAAVSEVYHKVFDRLQSEGNTIEFTGYSNHSETSNCIALISDGNEVQGVDSNSKNVEAVFLKTPFYGESGGQVGDHGRVSASGGFAAKVTDVQKPLPDLIVASLEVETGSLNLGDSVKQETDRHRRALTARNHTATHLLHWALREVLGSHVKQAGSLVTPDLLRFDFSHFNAMTSEEIERVETMINQKIWSGDAVQKKVMTKDEATQAGAIAFFGEKYGDEVRVISVGDYSIELCGGTHVESSSEIALFKVQSESGIAAGVRRIIANTSERAFDYLREMDERLKEIREQLKASSVEEIPGKIERIQLSEKELRKKLEKVRSQASSRDVDQYIESAQSIGPIRLIAKVCPSDPTGVKKLREISDQIKQKAPNAVAVLGMKAPDGSKAFLLSAVGPEAEKAADAKAIIQAISEEISGKGGGKPNLAQAGGTKPEGVEKAIQKAEDFIRDQLT